MFTRRHIAITIASLAAMSFSPAMLAQTMPKEEPGKRGGTLTMVVHPEPTTLVSAFDSGSSVGMVATKMFEGLVGYDFELNPIPELATGWEWSADGLSVTFKLRKNVKWHDGKPMTSADVAYSMMNIWKTLHSYGRSAFANVVAADTPDEHTVVFRLSKPSKYMMGNLNGYVSPVMPKHIYDGKDVRANPANAAPVGTGPYKFKEWSKGSYVRLERNPSYWKANRPYLDSMVVRFIPDAGARAVAFESGEVQLGVFNSLPLNTVRRLEKSPNFEVNTMGYEFTSTIFMLELNTRRAPFDKREVRQAVMHAIDRQALINVVWQGFGKVSTGAVPSTVSKFYEKDTPQYAFDPAKAEALLDAAGYPRKANGIRFKIVHDFLPYGSDLQRSAEFVKQQLAKVGIEVEIRSQDVASFVKRVYTDYDFDMTNTHLSALTDPTLGVQRLYWSKNIVKGIPFSNASGYANSEVDRLLEAAQVEPDDAKRIALFKEFQKIAQKDLPILNLFDMRPATVTSKKVRNHTLRGDAFFSNYADVFISQ